MPADKIGHPPPIVQSMLLADYIHRDALTGKLFILGTFSNILANAYPHTKRAFCTYLSLTGGHGPTVLRMRIADADEEVGAIHESVYPINMPDPNRVCELVFQATVLFPAPGDYRVQLYAGNDLLREVRLRAVLAQPNPHPPVEH